MDETGCRRCTQGEGTRRCSTVKTESANSLQRPSAVACGRGPDLTEAEVGVWDPMKPKGQGIEMVATRG